MKNQTGQVVIILLLIILVSLTVGLAIVQNSLTDVSTSTKTEQSSRAFSAAEAGLESALYTGLTLDTGDLGNQSKAKVTVTPNLPSGSQALEYPPISKADFAQFWLANPTDLVTGNYTAGSFTIYFGNCETSAATCSADADKPAIEVSVVTLSGGNYIFKRYFYDSDNTRTSANNFTASNCNTSGQSLPPPQNTSIYYCKVTVPPTGTYGTAYLARVRILYSSSPQKVALAPNTGYSLPPQATTYQSKGSAGDSVRQLNVFQERKVVPYFFDFAIFSNTDITK